MDVRHRRFVAALRQRGVHVAAPETLEVGPDVDPARFEPGPTVLHAGTRLFGARTLVLAGAELGRHGPVTLENSAVGRRTRLHGGAFSDAVLLDDVTVGSAAEFREGTLLEEGARAGHAVGLKQTVLLPWATLGSLVNFCDALLAGGTSAADHSEVGSGFIHFNFTPFGTRGDKATASLFGDVVHGALLCAPRIFLGGSGGAVGPVRAGFGAVLAAGSVLRRDLPDGMLGAAPAREPARDRPFDARRIRGAVRKVRHNLEYIGELTALAEWHRVVRAAHAAADPWLGLLYAEAQANLRAGLTERRRRLQAFVRDLRPAAEPTDADPALAAECRAQRALLALWPRLEERLLAPPIGPAAVLLEAAALAAFAGTPPGDVFVARVQALDAAGRAAAQSWLAAVAAHAGARDLLVDATIADEPS